MYCFNIEFELGVSWKVENKYTLFIQTPKYIGYRMAKIVEVDGFAKIKYASKVKADGSWIFKFPGEKEMSVNYRSQPAEPLG